MAVQNITVTDNYDSLLTMTLKNYRPTMVDQIMRGNPLLFVLNSKGRKRTVAGGDSIMIPLRYGMNDTVGFYSGYDVLNVTPQEGHTMARYIWKQSSVSITINGLEEFKNSGPHKLIDMLGEKTSQAEDSIKWAFNDHIHGLHGRSISGSAGKTHTGGDTNSKDSIGGSTVDNVGFNSLDHLVRCKAGYSAATPFNVVAGGITTSMDSDDNSGTNLWWNNYSLPGYGRITRSGEIVATTPSYIDTKANAVDTGENLADSLSYLQHLMTNNGERPDLILSGQELYDIYEVSQRSKIRYENPKLADAGFMTVKHNGSDFILDHGITTAIGATTISPAYVLNTKYLEWTVGKGKDFETTPFYRPEHQDARTAQILFYGQLCCSNRQKQGVLAATLAS
jgi:hypothetical protein